jgi:hypothetical protein
LTDGRELGNQYDMRSWYIVFETFALCRQGTQDPLPFNSKDECQHYIDNNCDPREFPELEFVEAVDPNDVLEYVRSKQ